MSVSYIYNKKVLTAVRSFHCCELLSTEAVQISDEIKDDLRLVTGAQVIQTGVGDRVNVNF